MKLYWLVFIAVIYFGYNTTLSAQMYDHPDYKVIIYYNTEFLGEKVNRFYLAHRPVKFLSKNFKHKDSVVVLENPAEKTYYVFDDGDSTLIPSPYEWEVLKFSHLYYETKTFKEYLLYSEFWYTEVKPYLVRDKERKPSDVYINCMYVIMNKTGFDFLYICWDGSIVYDNKVYMPNQPFINYLKTYLDHIKFDGSNLPPLPPPKLPRKLR